MTDPKTLAGFAAGVAATLLILILIALGVIYSGGFNVAATDGHAPVVRWAFETDMRNAVERGAEDVVAPETITPANVAAGAAEFKAMCEHCHGGPGAERAEWAKGMLPRPPNLAHAAEEWGPREVYWIVKHGIKMTGMPSFGVNHDEQTLWNIAAFVEQLPAMTAEEYAAFPGGGEAAPHGAAGGHAHEAPAPHGS